MEPISLRTPLALLLISLGAIAAVWWWLATPITLARAPIDPDAKLQCVSYAPFRGAQTPLVPTTHISAEQIAQDLAQLAKISDCVRTYSIENGLDQVPGLAAKVGLKVIQGIWLGSDRLKNLAQISTVIGLTKQYPDVISAVVVGNEVLLRGEMTTADLAAIIRSVKAQVSVPVTYADVWEYWLRNREIYDAVDFVTIHILPYWEDFPIRAKYAAAHVDAIRKRVAVAFPGKEILIGETGWPSEGRMREGALPSRTNQARVVSEILAMAKQENFRVNLIEAYDQPWKRQLEGTVGGYWGLIDSVQRALKYPPGEAISNFPFWKWQMGVRHGAGRPGVRRGLADPAPPALDAAAVVLDRGWHLGDVGRNPARRRRRQDVLRKLRFRRLAWLGRAAGGGHRLAVAVHQRADVGAGAADLSGIARPARWKTRSVLTILLGLVLAVTTLMAAETALGFVFDPRYRDFPFAALTMAVVPFSTLMLLNRPQQGARPIAEAVFAGLLAVSALYHRIQRRPGQLAVAVDLRDVFAARGYAVAGAGRANPKISRPIARPDSPIL